MNDSQKRKVRWWPALALLAGATGWIVQIGSSAESRQDQVMGTAGVLVLAGLLLFLWAILFSRFSGRTRLGIGVGALLLAIASFALFELKGFTGDMVPIFGLRFSSRTEEPLVIDSNPTPSAGEKAGSETQAWQDSTTFLGPTGNGHFPDVELDPDWETNPPEVVWRREIGPGCSGFAVVGSLAVTQEQRGEEELVVAYDLLTGTPRWKHGRNARYETPPGGTGPRATPVIADGRVFAFGGTGILDCLNVETGEVLWTHDTMQENGASVNDWGMSGSPLVVGNRVVLSVGGTQGRSLIAYDVEDGTVAWSAGDDRAGYATPRLLDLDDVEQIVIVNHSTVASHDPTTGALLWDTPWGGEYPNVADAVRVADDAIVVSSGYGLGAARLDVGFRADGEWGVETEWSSRFLKAKFSNFLFLEDVLYGFDDGIFACVDALSGKRRWKDGRYGHGQVLRLGDHLLVLAEFGELLVLDPDPDELRVVARTTVFDEKIWNTPTLAAPYLLLRNDFEAVCLRID